MNPDVAQTIQAVAIAIVSLIATAAVPWCIKIERRLSHIESGLTEQMNAVTHDVINIDQRLHKIELEHARYAPLCRAERDKQS